MHTPFSLRLGSDTRSDAGVYLGPVSEAGRCSTSSSSVGPVSSQAVSSRTASQSSEPDWGSILGSSVGPVAGISKAVCQRCCLFVCSKYKSQAVSSQATSTWTAASSSSASGAGSRGEGGSCLLRSCSPVS